MFQYLCPKCNRDLSVMHCTKVTLQFVNVTAGLFGKPKITEQATCSEEVMYTCPHCSEEITIDDIRVTVHQ